MWPAKGSIGATVMGWAGLASDGMPACAIARLWLNRRVGLVPLMFFFDPNTRSKEVGVEEITND